MLNKKQRHQKDLKLHHLYPSIKGLCACGCGKVLTGRKTRWFSSKCSTKCFEEFSIIKGSVSVIRKKLFKLDKGACRECGEITKDWEADHIIPVHRGGGACTLTNFQTLCKSCHKVKTYKQSRL